MCLLCLWLIVRDELVSARSGSASWGNMSARSGSASWGSMSLHGFRDAPVSVGAREHGFLVDGSTVHGFLVFPDTDDYLTYSSYSHHDLCR